MWDALYPQSPTRREGEMVVILVKSSMLPPSGGRYGTVRWTTVRCKYEKKAVPDGTAFLAMERVMGIEPTRPAWKAGVLTIELHPRTDAAACRTIHYKGTASCCQSIICCKTGFECRPRRHPSALRRMPASRFQSNLTSRFSIPVPIRILDEINAHFFIFIANDTLLPMKRPRGFNIGAHAWPDAFHCPPGCRVPAIP